MKGLNLAVICSFLPFQPAESAVFGSATTMAPQLDTAKHILIETLLKQGFENKLIASEASCSVRTVQRIRLEEQQFEMPNPRTNRVGRRSYIILPIREAFLDKLTKQYYLYQNEMADFLYRRFRKTISDRLYNQLAG